MAGLWYRTGSVSVTQSSKKVTGSGTSWLTALNRPDKGNVFYGPDGKAYEIDYVTAETEMYLVDAYVGANASAQSYKIDVRGGTVPELSRQLSEHYAYMQGIIDALQSIVSGSGDVTITGPSGQTVTVPALANMLSKSGNLAGLAAPGTALSNLGVSTFIKTLLDDADAATARATLGAQASDATLTALAGVTTAADKLIYATAPDVFTTTSITPFARTLIDDVDAAAMRTTLGIEELEPRISDNESKVFEALRRSYADAGFNLVEGSFEEGGELLVASDVMITASGDGYSWGGAFPHVVAPGTDPTTVAGYVPRTDATLRGEINSQFNAVLNEANATLAAAEAAHNITLINSQTYPDEATGRAAVADGAYFKVQGSGDVACFEYRRTNSSTSVLVATYPSKSFVESGKGTAGTARTAEGAGYDSINPDAPGYGITTRKDSGVSLIKGKVGYPITVNKVSNTGSSTWFGIHIKIPYGALSDLDKNFNFNAVAVAGVAPSTVNIVKEETDWNPVNNPVGIDVSKMMSGGTGVNLYQTIMASPHASVYQARTYLHILIAYYNPSSSVIDAATATWTVRPRFDSGLDVIANKVTPALQTSLLSGVEAELDQLSAFVVVPKKVLTDVWALKSNSSSTATIGTVYTRIEGGQTINTGYDVTLNNVSGYAYSYAKLFDTYATQASTKKYRVFVKSNNKDATIQVRFTNAASWGSSDGSIGQVTNETVLQLNAANNYQATVDIDYSSADIAAFYAQTVRLKAGYVILALDGIVSSQSVVFSTYCYEITPTSSSAADMTRGYVSTIVGLTELEQRVDSLSADLVPSYITCWGDSLTAGGGWTTTLATLSGLPVYNGGTGGENSQTIMARQGGDVMVVNNITIPATTTPVLIASRSTDGGIKTALGATVTPLLQGGAHVNPCYIGDVLGTLSWTGSSHADMNGTWTFTRSAAGSEVQIKRHTAIRTDFDINRNGSIQIIFIGQNGGYTSNDDLIRQHRLMIEHSTAKHTIILGLSSGSAASRADYEAAMKLAFGRYFISLREYLAAPIYTNGVITSCYGLDDAGITPTSADLTAIASGTVPPSLLADAVHYNTACKTVIGNMLYKKMKDLNVF